MSAFHTKTTPVAHSHSGRRENLQKARASRACPHSVVIAILYILIRQPKKTPKTLPQTAPARLFGPFSSVH